MFCPTCGKQLADGYAVCPFCGKNLNEDAQPVQNSAPQQQYSAPQQQYSAPQQQYAAPQAGIPRAQLECNRSWIKVLLLTIVTCGIYGIITYYKLTEDVNTICTPHDNKKTMNYLVAMLLLTPVTCGIYSIVWMHQLCNRVGDNLRARGIPSDFSASTFWLWNVLGSFIVVGPFIFMHKLFEATNQLAADYNARG